MTKCTRRLNGVLIIVSLLSTAAALLIGNDLKCNERMSLVINIQSNYRE